MCCCGIPWLWRLSLSAPCGYYGWKDNVALDVAIGGKGQNTARMGNQPRESLLKDVHGQNRKSSIAGHTTSSCGGNQQNEQCA